MKTKVGPRKFNEIREIYRTRMMQGFDVQVKRSYDGGNTLRSVELRAVEDNLDEDIRRGTLILSGYK